MVVNSEERLVGERWCGRISWVRCLFSLLKKLGLCGKLVVEKSLGLVVLCRVFCRVFWIVCCMLWCWFS